jgi:hypothetical protein
MVAQIIEMLLFPTQLININHEFVLLLSVPKFFIFLIAFP